MPKQRQQRDLIPGGRAMGRRPEEFDPQQLSIGQRVEMEHTTDPRVAREIAMDHLTEDPEYYRKLARIDREAAEIYQSVTGRARPEQGARMPRKKMTEVAVLHVDAVAAREIRVGRRRRRRPEQEMESNPRRPPRQWFRDCVAGVEAGGSAYDPQAVCGAQWQRLSASQKRAAVRRHERRRNPYDRYANPWRY